MKSAFVYTIKSPQYWFSILALAAIFLPIPIVNPVGFAIHFILFALFSVLTLKFLLGFRNGKIPDPQLAMGSAVLSLFLFSLKASLLLLPLLVLKLIVQFPVSEISRETESGDSIYRLLGQVPLSSFVFVLFLYGISMALIRGTSKKSIRILIKVLYCDKKLFAIFWAIVSLAQAGFIIVLHKYQGLPLIYVTVMIPMAVLGLSFPQVFVIYVISRYKDFESIIFERG